MKTRTLVSILIIVLAILIVSSCATTPKTKVISRSEPLSSDKAYLACVCYYANPYRAIGYSSDPWLPPCIRLRGDNKEKVDIDFPENPRPEIVVVEVEPGEYTVKGIYKYDDFYNKRVMGIPPNLRDKIPVVPGSITYLGDFSIIRSTGFLLGTVLYKSSYNYDFVGFRNMLEREYNVPETFEYYIAGDTI